MLIVALVMALYVSLVDSRWLQIRAKLELMLKSAIGANREIVVSEVAELVPQCLFALFRPPPRPLPPSVLEVSLATILVLLL